MSFCFDTKQEICAQEEKHKKALLYGMLLFADSMTNGIQITTENVFVINLLTALSSELFGAHFTVEESMSAFTATLCGDGFERICKEFDLDPDAPHLSNEMIERTGHLAAFLKGAFLVGGSINNPRSGYHFELVCHHYQLSKEIAKYLKSVDFSFKTVVRKSQFVLYLKDSVVLERLLYVLGAKKAAFELVDTKIYKQIQNENNRINNCAGYNQEKSLDKAVEQILSICKIEDTVGLASLSEDLQEIAVLRRQNKTASLSELCRLSGGKFSKAGLSRRLTKIVDFANNLKQ